MSIVQLLRVSKVGLVVAVRTNPGNGALHPFHSVNSTESLNGV